MSDEVCAFFERFILAFAPGMDANPPTTALLLMGFLDRAHGRSLA